MDMTLPVLKGHLRPHYHSFIPLFKKQRCITKTRNRDALNCLSLLVNYTVWNMRMLIQPIDHVLLSVIVSCYGCSVSNPLLTPSSSPRINILQIFSFSVHGMPRMAAILIASVKNAEKHTYFKECYSRMLKDFLVSGLVLHHLVT